MINNAINLSSVPGFLMGVLVTSLLFVALYSLAVIKSFNRKIKIKKREQEIEEIDEQEIKKIIKEAQKNLKKNSKTKITEISFDMIKEITALYFPKSKQPYLEITIDEAIVIAKYVTNRLDQIFEIKVFHLVKGMTIKQLLDINKTKNKIDNLKLMKTIKSLYFKRIMLIILSFINFFNPVYWFKKGVIDNIIKIISKKISLELISIIGEETYKIYSKKILYTEEEKEIEMEKMYEKIQEEIETIKNAEKVAYGK